MAQVCKHCKKDQHNGKKTKTKNQIQFIHHVFSGKGEAQEKRFPVTTRFVAKRQQETPETGKQSSHVPA